MMVNYSVITIKNKTYNVRVTSVNEPSEEAIKNFRKAILDVLTNK